MTARQKPIAGRLLLIGFLAAVVGLVGAAVTGSSVDLSYQVRLAEPAVAGNAPACKSTVLFVDSRTGAELPCSGTPFEGFTAADREQILKLAADLAAVGGIDTAEEFELTELAAEIGRTHGDASSRAGPIAFGVIAALGGAAFATGITLKIVAAVRRYAQRR